jgi:hypothetical protein
MGGRWRGWPWHRPRAAPTAPANTASAAGTQRCAGQTNRHHPQTLALSTAAAQRKQGWRASKGLALNAHPGDQPSRILKLACIPTHPRSTAAKRRPLQLQPNSTERCPGAPNQPTNQPTEPPPTSRLWRQQMLRPKSCCCQPLLPKNAPLKQKPTLRSAGKKQTKPHRCRPPWTSCLHTPQKSLAWPVHAKVHCSERRGRRSSAWGQCIGRSGPAGQGDNAAGLGQLKAICLARGEGGTGAPCQLCKRRP